MQNLLEIYSDIQHLEILTDINLSLVRMITNFIELYIIIIK